MNDFEELVDKYFASLNETDGHIRRRLIEATWSENGDFISPIGAVRGYAAIDIQIQEFQKQFPAAEVRRVGSINVLAGSYLRFAFEAVQSDAAPFIEGVDFGIVSDGKLHLVAGFFDPALQAAN